MEWGRFGYVQVLAIRILQFSIRFGELTAMVLSRINPEDGLILFENELNV